jgi:hypothetical protein
MSPGEIDLYPVRSWTEAQELLAQRNKSFSADIILIDINFEEDRGAPPWKQPAGGPPYGNKKPTGLFIGLAFSGTLHQSDMPRIAMIHTYDPSLFKDDPAARTAAALLDAVVSGRRWTNTTIDEWFDSENLPDDVHFACRDTIGKFRQKVLDWCRGGVEARLVVSPASHWRAEKALKSLIEGIPLSTLRDKLTLEFVTASGAKRTLNLCSLFADVGLSRSLTDVEEFLKGVGYFQKLLEDCEASAKVVAAGKDLTAAVPASKVLERAVVIILRLVDWWREKQEQWEIGVSEGWDLKKGRPDPTSAVGLKRYLTILGNLLAGVGPELDISNTEDLAQEIQTYVDEQEGEEEPPEFTAKSLRYLLPMLVETGVLVRGENGLWSVETSMNRRAKKVDGWTPIIPVAELREQDFLPTAGMKEHTEFKRIIEKANKGYGLSLPDQWDGGWHGDGDFRLPWFLRVIVQEYARERLKWHEEHEWPAWLRD